MMRVLELFGGIGAWHKALKRIGIPCELVGFSEVNPYAVEAYCAIHNEPESKNLGDIRSLEADRISPVDLICASPPCQSFSVAGKQKGVEDERGKLFFETLRIIGYAMPKYCLIENVKGLTFKKFEPILSRILTDLDGLGYNVYHKVLDAKDYGVPQSRKRLFFVCVRKDADDVSFQFPSPVPLETTLRDLLENDVDEKYYISGKHLVYWNKNRERDVGKGFSAIDKDIAVCQTARQYANWKGNYVSDTLNCLGLINNRDSQGSRVYDDNISCTVSATGGGLGNVE